MKLPFDLGVKLILRLLVPGFFLTLGIYPFLATLREKAGWTIDIEYLFILSVIVTGWVVTVADQPLYMVFEGRRYWPKWLLRIFLSLENRRLQKLIRDVDKFYALAEGQEGFPKFINNQKYTEASVEKRNFPLDDEGHLKVTSPTRLGNLINAFETYPDRRYGVDAVFYWYRIWLKLDKDLREELDTRQASTDSALYSSAVLFVSALLWSTYALIPTAYNPFINHLPTFLPMWLPALFFLLTSRMTYKVSLYSQAQYGETFKSVFDIYEKQIDVNHVLNSVSKITKDPSILNLDRSDQLLIAWRYLHNYKVRCRRVECKDLDPMSPEDFQRHFSRIHGFGPKLPVPESIPKEYYPPLVRSNEIEQEIFIIKWLDIIFGLTALGLGLFIHYLFFLIACVTALVLWVIEYRMRRNQVTYIDKLIMIETQCNTTPLYEKLKDPIWLRPSFVLPHVAIMLPGLILFVLKAAGAI